MTVILSGKEVDVSALLDIDYVCKFEIVDGEYQIEKLEGEANVTASKEQGA